MTEVLDLIGEELQRAAQRQVQLSRTRRRVWRVASWLLTVPHDGRRREPAAMPGERPYSGATDEPSAPEVDPRHLRLAWRYGRRLRRRRRLLVSALGTCVAVAVGAVVLFAGSAVVHPSSAVAFSTAPGGDIIATVTDPFAAQKELDSAFAARGFDITVQLVPVSPSLVGTVVTFSLGNRNPASQIEPLEGGACVEGSAGCPIGVKIPATFTGSAYIVLGRPAQSGEAYAATASAFGPGEALHCSGLLGARVSAAAPVLAADGLTVTQWRASADGASGEPTNSQITATPPPPDYYIWSADPVSPTQVRIWTESASPSADPALAAQDARLNQGC